MDTTSALQGAFRVHSVHKNITPIYTDRANMSADERMTLLKRALEVTVISGESRVVVPYNLFEALAQPLYPHQELWKWARSNDRMGYVGPFCERDFQASRREINLHRQWYLEYRSSAPWVRGSRDYEAARSAFIANLRYARQMEADAAEARDLRELAQQAAQRRANPVVLQLSDDAPPAPVVPRPMWELLAEHYREEGDEETAARIAREGMQIDALEHFSGQRSRND